MCVKLHLCEFTFFAKQKANNFFILISTLITCIPHKIYTFNEDRETKKNIAFQTITRVDDEDNHEMRRAPIYAKFKKLTEMFLWYQYFLIFCHHRPSDQ